MLLHSLLVLVFRLLEAQELEHLMHLPMMMPPLMLQPLKFKALLVMSHPFSVMFQDF